MADLVDELDALAPQLAALVEELPADRSEDEAEAVEAMGACLVELRRMAPALAPSLAEFHAAGDDREQRHLALRRLLHDIRSPISVLYSYLQLIERGLLFANASPHARAHAGSFVSALRLLRDVYLQTPLLHDAQPEQH